jgi:hypothetical protein
LRYVKGINCWGPSLTNEFWSYRQIFTLFADEDSDTNGIKNFWKNSKRHMRKFNCFSKAL